MSPHYLGFYIDFVPGWLVCRVARHRAAPNLTDGKCVAWEMMCHCLPNTTKGGDTVVQQIGGKKQKHKKRRKLKEEEWENKVEEVEE